MRLKDYFFDQFLGALTAEATPKHPTVKWFTQSRKSEKINYAELDLGQSDSYVQVEIIINAPKILIKDRPHFKEALILDIESVKLTNSADFIPGRWYNHPERLFKEQTFNVKVKQAKLKYNTHTLSNAFCLELDIKNPEVTPAAEMVPHEELDKSLHINIFIKELLKLKLSQKVYTYLLRCLDLNLNYNDEMQHEHEFKNFIDLERLEMDQQAFVSMRVGVIINHFSIEVLNNDDSFIAEIFYDNAHITYLDKGIKEVKIWTNNFYILEDPKKGYRDIVMAPLKLKNTIKNEELLKTRTNYKHYNMEIIMHPSGDKAITWTIDKVKVFFKPYLTRKLLSFFTEAMPDYDYSSEKPNGYYKRNGDLASKDPSSKMTFIFEIQKSMFLMTNEQQSDRVVVLDTHMNFTFHRENYQDCKELLKTKFDREYQKYKAMNSFVSTNDFAPESEIQMPVGFMTLNLLDANFRICKVTEIKSNKRKMMSPCNIFYSSKSMMELDESGTYFINSEQNFNVDKTFLKFSIKDMACFSDTVMALMADLQKFNDEHENAAPLDLRESEIVDEINKDLDFYRHGKTFIGNLGDSQEGSVDLIEKARSGGKVAERNVSELHKNIGNTLKFQHLDRSRKATDDMEIVDRTGSIANPDQDNYQSRLLSIGDRQKSELVRLDECQKGHDSIDLCLTGLRIVLMNEQDNIYYPVMDFNVSEVHLEQVSNAKCSKGKTCTYVSCFYYNAQLGEWEPFIENFRLLLEMDSFSNKS